MTTQSPSVPQAADAELPAVLGGFDLTDQAGYAAGVPYDVFARLRREAPVFYHPQGRTADGDGFWVLTRHADIARAASDPVFSAQGGGSRAGGGSHLDDLPFATLAGVLFAMMDNPRHDRVKKLLAPAVTGAVALGLSDELRSSAHHLLQSALDATGPVDFVDDVAEPFALQSIAVLLGAPRADWPQLTAWVHEVLGFIDRRTGEIDEHSRATFVEMQQYFGRMLDAKRADPADDLGTLLAVGEIEGDSTPLTAKEREANANLILITGLEQPRNTVAGGVLALAHHPEQWQKLRADRTLLTSAVEEILRWNPPNPYNRRTATQDVDLHGTLIRAGEKVTLWWPSANRDESVFAEADTFDITRDPNPHLSFGHGIHLCLGEQFARLQLRLFLTELLDTVAEIRLTGPVVHAPNNKHTVLLDMPVELVPATA
ncbi:cytochrome P450 [Streptomyces beijiangensis]|uniref:Cytochrome P450 n=1 Tax=Streptomyces beijiangensis TaxID=163361 RepID=A0A939F8A7_9ACTN|nr:cytochrome P450 [Streptomyces beijiangensis]MBO0513489.1 cytochrome P450 [Streptomyces beijiangensis]